MSHTVSIPKEELERVMNAAEAARIVVAVEQAYDVIDEMSSNPDKFFDSLEKLSRLVRKVLNDIKDELKYVDETLKKLEKEVEKQAGEVKERFQKEKEMAERNRRDLNTAYNRLMDWSQRCRELTEILTGKDPASRREIVKIFAALAVAPDWFSERIAEILKG